MDLLQTFEQIAETLKVGDIVACPVGRGCSDFVPDEIDQTIKKGKVVEVTVSGIRFSAPHGDIRSAVGCLHTKLEKWPCMIVTSQSPKSLSSTMSTIIEKFQNFFAEPNDLMLKKYGIENPTGTPTQEGLTLLMNLLYRERRTDVIATVAKIASEDEAAAAKTK